MNKKDITKLALIEIKNKETGKVTKYEKNTKPPVRLRNIA